MQSASAFEMLLILVYKKSNMREAQPYTTEFSQATCDTCPLRSVSEGTLVNAIQPGVTAFEAADVVTSNATINAEVYREMSHGSDVPLDELRRDAMKDTVDTLRVNVIASAGPEAEPAAPGLFIQAVRGCVYHKFNQQCAIDQSPTSAEAFPAPQDVALGANVLEAIAKDGSTEDVYTYLIRLTKELALLHEEATGRETAVYPHLLPEAEARAQLFRIAEMLRAGDFHIDTY